MQFTIIGNPENRRVSAFCEALQQLGHSSPNVISYADWLSGKARISISPESLVKIDSPGENEAVRTMLVARGKGVTMTKPAEHGEIKDMRAWYKGYSNWLLEMKMVLEEQPTIQVMNHPADIQLQFYKPVCQGFLEDKGIPVPHQLPSFTHYDELVHHMQQQHIHKVFIKPAHASSASGVIAFRKAGHRVQAVTTAEMVTTNNGLQLFNSLKVLTYTNESAIAALVNRMVAENIFVVQRNRYTELSTIPGGRLAALSFTRQFYLCGTPGFFCRFSANTCRQRQSAAYVCSPFCRQ